MLEQAIRKAIGDKPIQYLITDDFLEFAEHEQLFHGKNYTIREFGEYYVAFIF